MCQVTRLCQDVTESRPVIVRAARPAELGTVGDLRAAAYHAGHFLAGQSGYEPILRALGADGTGMVLVAVPAGDDVTILGTVMLQHWPDTGQVVTGPGEAEIRALAVAPSAQGRGTGSALLRAVIDRAAGDGVTHLLLSTQPQMHTAHRLYERAGFRRLADRDWSPGPGVNLLAYGLALAPAGLPAQADSADAGGLARP